MLGQHYHARVGDAIAIVEMQRGQARAVRGDCLHTCVAYITTAVQIERGQAGELA